MSSRDLIESAPRRRLHAHLFSSPLVDAGTREDETTLLIGDLPFVTSTRRSGDAEFVVFLSDEQIPSWAISSLAVKPARPLHTAAQYSWLVENLPESAQCFLREQSTSAGSARQNPPQHASPESAARLRVARLTEIQAAFGLPIQSLAAVLGISRAQLYKWLDPLNDVLPHGSSHERLAVVERLAARWRSLTDVPLSQIAHEPLQDGRTLLAWMSDSTIDESAVRAAMADVAERLTALGPTPGQRLAQAGFTRRRSHRALPSDDE